MIDYEEDFKALGLHLAFDWDIPWVDESTISGAKSHTADVETSSIRV